jgi:hypothetical protein
MLFSDVVFNQSGDVTQHSIHKKVACENLVYDVTSFGTFENIGWYYCSTKIFQEIQILKEEERRKYKK